MEFSAKAVANEFIHLAGGLSLSPMKLQKLVYFAHGWYLALTGKPLIREAVEAWQFGPVIPELYAAFKQFGAGGVRGFATEHDLYSHQEYTPRIVEQSSMPESHRALEVIREVWSSYGSESAIKLSNATHMAGTPWSQVYNPNSRHAVIPDATIMAYFRGLRG